jgi:hypothetical protein
METACARKSKIGVLAEIFFYFLDDGPASEVAAFRDSLIARCFLFSAVADSETFAARLLEHRRHTAMG